MNRITDFYRGDLRGPPLGAVEVFQYPGLIRVKIGIIQLNIDMSYQYASK